VPIDELVKLLLREVNRVPCESDALDPPGLHVAVQGGCTDAEYGCGFRGLYQDRVTVQI